LQKYYTPNHLMNKCVKNNGQVDSYYIEGNHPPIVSKDMWAKVQEEIIRRGKAKGNIAGDREKYQNRYPLTGMLYCSKCGFTLIRRTWNSKLSCRKIVWQCSNYISNGKASCSGTRVDDKVIGKLNVTEETIVKEETRDGKKHYIYTSKSPRHQSTQNLEPQKKRMAAYCRVSTDHLEQLSSYEAQVRYYTNYIENHPDYEWAGIYASEF